MIGVIAAIAICLLSSSSRIVLKRGLSGVSPLVGTVISMFIGFAMLSVVAVPRWILRETPVPTEGLLWFLGIGLIAPPVVRGLTYIGISRVGVARTDQIRATQPLFAVLFAYLILAERPTLLWYPAAALILLGVYLLIREQTARLAQDSHSLSRGAWMYPLGAALIAGLVAIARKQGTGKLDDPVLAAFLASIPGLIVGLFYLVASGRWRELSKAQGSLKLLLIAGVLTAGTDILDLLALAYADVHVVAPILATTPLFATLLAAIFLKDERITRITWVAAALVLMGLQLSFWGAR